MGPYLPLAQLVPDVPPEIAILVIDAGRNLARPTMAVIEGRVRKALGLTSPRQTGQTSVFSQQLTVNAINVHTGFAKIHRWRSLE